MGKNKKIFYIITGSVVLVLLGLYILIFKFSFGSSLIPVKYLSAEQVAQLVSTASINNNNDFLWDSMHPDDKARWKNKDEYLSTLIHQDLSYKKVSTKEVKNIISWTHPVTGKIYTNVKQITDEFKTNDGNNTTTDTYMYGYYNDRWYFFSQLFSSKDKESIKDQAVSGPSYAELSKNANKFKGMKVKYTGKVEQIQENDNTGKLLVLDVTDLGFGFWKDAIWVSYDKGTNIIQGDIINVYGILSGVYTYTSEANYNISIPSIDGAVIEKDQK